ncbi:MAG TPA: hypothetical protein VFQ61_29225 [Polyangiaceae bacterium]|nr:hypothetical protein [Polyangiaceae bacterium]
MRWRCSACQTENLGRHKVCQNCTKPKDREPFYDAPEAAQPDPSQGVSDAGLIAKATAGADWCCRYCGSHQPRNTGECKNCGAPEAEASQPASYVSSTAAASSSSAAQDPNLEPSRPRVRRRYIVLAGLVGLIALLFLVFRSREVEARVVQRAWQHTVVVERYRIVPGEGFSENRPAEAFDVVQRGERHHHNQRVQDGTVRESYSERVACGEDCSTSPVRCSSNDNGFKTCSGGDRVCRTRYCSETRYRDVPRYKDVPVFQTWYSWRVWAWHTDRTLVEKGTEEAPRWPSEVQLHLGAGCGPGEKERTRQEFRYDVEFETPDHDRYPYVAGNLAEFTQLSLGTQKRLRVGRAHKTEIVP